MSRVAEISVQSTQDQNERLYHTRHEITSNRESGVRGGDNQLNGFGCLVLGLPGVVQVHMAPYVLLITKATLFNWNEISPSVESLLKDFAASQRQIEECYPSHQ